MNSEIEILQLDKTQSYPPMTGSETRSWKTAEKLDQHGTLWRASPWDGHTQLPDSIRLIALTSPVVTSKAICNHAWYGGFTIQTRHPIQRLITKYVVSRVSNADVNFDIVISEAPELVDAARRLAAVHGAKLLLNKHNCYFDFFDQYLRDKRLPLPIRKRAVHNLYEHEQQGISDADVIVFQSEDDRERFDVPSSTPVRVIPNGTDYEELQHDGNPDRLARELGIPNDQQVCLFIGSFDYEPNNAAATFVIKELSPAFPEMVFLLIGRNPPPSTAPNVYAPGYVTDLVDALRLADIAMCPLPRGSGTKLKMLDYFAAGLPVVTTTVGTQGLPIRDGEHALVRDDPTAMKAAIRELAENEGRREHLAQRGHTLGEQFAWNRLLRGYDDLIDDLSSNRNG